MLGHTCHGGKGTPTQAGVPSHKVAKPAEEHLRKSGEREGINGNRFRVMQIPLAVFSAALLANAGKYWSWGKGTPTHRFCTYLSWVFRTAKGDEVHHSIILHITVTEIHIYTRLWQCCTKGL